MQELREETWALMTPLPIFAYVVRPVGGGPYPLLIMNHGISGDPQQRGFFPFIEYRDAAHWFARRGYFVVSPVRYGGVSIDRPDQGLFSLYFASVGDCDKPNFRWPGLMIATLDQWVIDFMEKEATRRAGEGHRCRPIRWRMGSHRPVQPEPVVGPSDHHLCSRPRRTSRW